MALSRREFLAAPAALAASPAKPNIVVVLSDQQHWQAAGFMDSTFDTPHFDALAASGCAFTHAFCTTPQCSPSRSSLLTGFYPSTTGVLGNIGSAGGSPLRMETIGKKLQRAGYDTAYFGKWHLGNDALGTAGWDQAGRDIADQKMTARALAYLQDRPANRPYALFLSYLEPHHVYNFKPDAPPSRTVPLPNSWRETFEGKPPAQKQFMTGDQGKIIWGRSEKVWEAYRAFYRDCVHRYDAELGRVLAAVDASNTIVLASTDHGDMDANHKLIFKGPFMYEHMIRIPLVIRVPGGPRGVRIENFDAVNCDVVPTLLDYAGAAPEACDGISLRPFLANARTKPSRDYVIGQYHGKQDWVVPIRMLRTREWKYTRYRDGAEELYNLRADPDELTNYAADPGHAGRKRELSGELTRWMSLHRDNFGAQKS